MRNIDQWQVVLIEMVVIPKRDVVDQAREQTGLGQSEENPNSEEAMVIFDQRDQSADGAPGDHLGGEPEIRANLLHEQIGWDLKSSVDHVE